MLVAHTVESKDLGQDSWALQDMKSIGLIDMFTSLPTTALVFPLASESNLLVDGLMHVLEVMGSKLDKGLEFDLGKLLHDESIVSCLQERRSRLASGSVPFHTASQRLDVRIFTSTALAQRMELFHVKDLAVQHGRSVKES